MNSNLFVMDPNFESAMDSGFICDSLRLFTYVGLKFLSVMVSGYLPMMMDSNFSDYLPIMDLNFHL